jgi:predicted NAD/FAD-dependent oxidoreductase
MNVAIIGAGVAGLSAARDLSAQGVQVQLFDKSRGVGGRMTTRYAGDWEFDHGAQYFTVSDDGFRAEIDAAISAGVVAPWPARAAYLKTGLLTADTGRPRYVGSPRMNSLPKHWAQGLDIALGRRVSAITRGETWSLAFEDGTSETGFDAVICTLPPAQAQDILPADFAKMAEVKAAKMHVCFTLMVGMKAPIDPGFDTLRVKDLPVDWIAINHAKPGRNTAFGAIVVNAEPTWADAHQGSDRAEVQDTLLKCASALLGLPLENAPHLALHRWLYASSKTSPGVACLTGDGIVAAGDWCLGGRVENAWLSGRAAARALLA